VLVIHGRGWMNTPTIAATCGAQIPAQFTTISVLMSPLFVLIF